MKLCGFLGFGNKVPKSKILSNKYASEVKEACDQILQAGYNDIKVKEIDKYRANIAATRQNESYTVDLDFSNRTQTERAHSKSYVFSIIDPIRECTKTLKATMDGVAKTLKTVMKRSSNDGKNFTETTDYKNFISGNSYRRVKSSSGETKYYKNIDNDYVELFPKN